MPDFAILLNLPTESVAVRAVVGSLVALVLVSILLRALRVPRVRSAAVLVPMAALTGAVLASWNDLLLPVIMTVTDHEQALPVLVRDNYVRFAPVGWPLFAGWLTVAALRVGRRLRRYRRLQLLAASGGAPRDLRVRRTLAAVSARMRVPMPRVVIVDGCPGGALVVGIGQPTVIIDATLLATLDDAELEGLLAHEVAHIRRRDNLLGMTVGLVRDAFFFVPGGRWVTNRLCDEREFVADTLAVDATDRPGALASGLLKVVDSRRLANTACAAFGTQSALVARVERLCATAAPAGSGRATAESAAVAAALTAAVALAVHLPATVAGSAGERDAIALLWAWETTTEGMATTAEPAVFDAFRRLDAHVPAPAAPPAPAVTGGEEFHPSYLRGDRQIEATTPQEAAKDQVVRAKLEEDLIRSWRARPVVAADDGVGVYWLRRLQ